MLLRRGVGRLPAVRANGRHAHFRARNIPVIVYTDQDLEDYDQIFVEIAEYLTPSRIPKQLEFHAMEEFLSFKSPS